MSILSVTQVQHNDALTELDFGVKRRAYLGMSMHNKTALVRYGNSW